MVSDPVLGIDVVANVGDAEAKLDKLDDKENKLVRKWDRDARRLHSEMSRVMRAIRGITRVVSNTFRVFGASLTPVQEAYFAMIGVTMTSILQVHRTLEAATVGIAGTFTIGLSLIAIAMSGANLAAVASGFNTARNQIGAAQSLVDSLISVALPGTFGGGYYY